MCLCTDVTWLERGEVYCRTLRDTNVTVCSENRPTPSWHREIASPFSQTNNWKGLTEIRVQDSPSTNGFV